jgi:hypothetical protein
MANTCIPVPASWEYDELSGSSSLQGNTHSVGAEFLHERNGSELDVGLGDMDSSVGPDDPELVK